jgi:hypothetical protein
MIATSARPATSPSEALRVMRRTLGDDAAGGRDRSG